MCRTACCTAYCTTDPQQVETSGVWAREASVPIMHCAQVKLDYMMPWFVTLCSVTLDLACSATVRNTVYLNAYIVGHSLQKDQVEVYSDKS